MPFWSVGEFGTLRTNASLPAMVIVDGRTTGRTTPVGELRLEAGRHTVRWVSVATGATVEEPVTIDAGVQTTVNVRFGSDAVGEATSPPGP
ncbi:MAG: PEGA domain-containing protein [Myxococcales bacterium]|nr:PEGA domain-containing protein [Myxococcales bacterium]MCB9531651.1 PEGA domain-containing protein [Myxococcales bacterium]